MMAPPNLQKFGSDNFKGDISFGIIIYLGTSKFLFRSPFLFFMFAAIGIMMPMVQNNRSLDRAGRKLTKGGKYMATNNVVNARQRQKIDTAANWKTAGENGFIPLNGEIIVYKDLNKIKIGDGVKTVDQLSFIDEGLATEGYVADHYISKGGDMFDENAELILSKSARSLIVDGGSVTLDTSKVTGGWANDIIAVKDANSTIPLLGAHGYAGSLSAAYFGGSYSDPHLKYVKTGDFTFKNRPKVGTADVALKTDINEAALAWGVDSTSGYISPIEVGCSDVHSANRFAFSKPEGITIEYSRDGGSTYAPYETTDVTKISLVSGVGASYAIGARNSEENTVDDKLRIILDATTMGVYTKLIKLLINVSTNYARNCYVIVEKAMKGSETTFTEVGTYPISGWSAWNSIPIQAPFGGYDASQTSNIAILRLTFGCIEVVNGKKNGLSILDIVAIGDTFWTVPSSMAKHGHIYSYNGNQDVSFPATVSATNFQGRINGCTVGTSVPADAKFTDTTYTAATTSKAGLMSTTDKSHLDSMWNIWSADGTEDTLVNKVEEVVSIFQNYPEGNTIVEALASKVTAEQVEGIVQDILQASVYNGETEDVQ